MTVDIFPAARTVRPAHSINDNSSAQGSVQDGYKVVKEEKIYSRYMQMYNRTIQYPDGTTYDFDVCGHANSQFRFTVVMPFNTKTQKFTVISEFSQGCGRLLYCFPTGGLDPAKHVSMEAYVDIRHSSSCR
jgi:hypothetical protein